MVKAIALMVGSTVSTRMGRDSEGIAGMFRLCGGKNTNRIPGMNA